MTQVHYLMQGDEIIFSGTAQDCKRLQGKTPDTRIEPPVAKAQARKEDTKWDF